MIDLINQTDRLFEQIKTDFDSLWSVKQRNATIEYITPYTTLTGDAVSVFVTQRDNGYVITDAGCIFDLAAEQEVELGERKTLHYAELVAKFGIKVIAQRDQQKVFCYKNTMDLNMVSSCIYDMANFQQTLMNAILLDTIFSSQETASAKYFNRRVRDTLREKVRALSSDKHKYELYLGEEAKLFQFTTGIREVGTELFWIGMGICRTNLQNFRHSVLRAEFGFKYIGKSENIKMASVSDVLPTSLIENRGVGILQTAMGKWESDYGVSNYKYEDVESLDNMTILFGNPAA